MSSKQLQTTAQAHFHNIVLARRWNAMYGGVFVEKTPEVISNPYLENPDISCYNGKTYTKKNPALMTKEISELAKENDGFQFHITSLTPLNPDNSPDEFERKALKAFEQGKKEFIAQEKNDGTLKLRYMAPLYTEEACLPCHAAQGYKIGDVRGGISITFDIDEFKKIIQFNRLALIILFTLTIGLILSIFYFHLLKVIKQLRRAEEKIKRMAITDDLTGLYNRRFFYERFEEEISRSLRHDHNIACILLDLDHFKKINDTYGHCAGDVVLQAVGNIITTKCRKSDIAARYGGEEFILLLPECGMDCALQTAEKIRTMIKRRKISVTDQKKVQITCSIGVSFFTARELNKMGCVKATDKTDMALYRAKEKGRDRVEIA